MFGNYFMIAPQLRIYEDIICRHYYDKIEGQGHIALTEDLDESLCKLDEIQEELAVVMGGLSVVDSVPGEPDILQQKCLKLKIEPRSFICLAVWRSCGQVRQTPQSYSIPICIQRRVKNWFTAL
jgi:hypothetical protein